MRFTNSSDARRWVVRHLDAAGLNEESSRALCDEVLGASEVYEWPEFPPGTLGLMVPIKHWVIRDDDLGVATTLAAVMSFATAGGLASGARTAEAIASSLASGALASVVAGGAVAARAIIWKRAEVTPLHYRVLRLLKTSRSGLTIEALCARLNEPPPALPYRVADVQAYLDDLKAVRLRNGEVVALVSVDSNGFWSASGI